MPTHVLLSVKPQFAEAILAGKKTYEFRRAVFRRQDVETVVLYASSPVCKVVGEFTVQEVLSLSLDALWERTHDGGAIDREYFNRYFLGRKEGYALKVKRAHRYRSPLCLKKDLGITHPPQSFCYLSCWRAFAISDGPDSVRGAKRTRQDLKPA